MRTAMISALLAVFLVPHVAAWEEIECEWVPASGDVAICIHVSPEYDHTGFSVSEIGDPTHQVGFVTLATTAGPSLTLLTAWEYGTDRCEPWDLPGIESCQENNILGPFDVQETDSTTILPNFRCTMDWGFSIDVDGDRDPDFGAALPVQMYACGDLT